MSASVSTVANTRCDEESAGKEMEVATVIAAMGVRLASRHG